MAQNEVRVLRYYMLAVLMLLVIFNLTVNYANWHWRLPLNQGSQTDTIPTHKNTHTDVNNTVDQSQSYQRANATFLTVTRNKDLWSLVNSIRDVEDRFNHKYHYDWVFLDDEPFDETFIKVTKALVSGKAKYELIPKEQWSVPEWIDKAKFDQARDEMRRNQVIYGDSIPMRKVSRFQTGFIWRHPALDRYKYYWRVDPDIKLACDINYDIFKFMEDNNKQFGFAISLYEFMDTIPTLWDTVKEFIKDNAHHMPKNNMMDFISDDDGETYSKCQFWSTFEIASLDFYRGEAYTKYFEHLDQAGGIFYERWSEGPIHTIGASLFLEKDEIHFFEELGFYHVPFWHCPASEEVRLKNRCTCGSQTFTWRGSSCVPRYYDVKKLERPEGWSELVDSW